MTGYQTTGWSRRNSDISARFCCWSFSKSIDSLKSFVELKWLMNIFNTCWTNAGCKSKIGVRFDLVSYHFKCDWLDPNGGSVPFHHLTKQRVATIENYWKNIGFNGCWTKNHRKTFGTNGWWSYWKHRKNCECCHHHSLFKGHNVNVKIVVPNCQKCYQCLKCQVSGHKYRGLPFEGVI